MDKMYKVEQVAVKIDCSVHTIDNWYRWKRIYANDESMKEYIDLLPDPKQSGSRQTRLWTKEDIKKLKEFKKKIPKGRNGIMGEVTQKGVKKWQERN